MSYLWISDFFHPQEKYHRNDSVDNRSTGRSEKAGFFDVVSENGCLNANDFVAAVEVTDWSGQTPSVDRLPS